MKRDSLIYSPSIFVGLDNERYPQFEDVDIRIDTETDPQKAMERAWEFLEFVASEFNKPNRPKLHANAKRKAVRK